jgi:hypothetical protein
MDPYEAYLQLEAVRSAKVPFEHRPTVPPSELVQAGIEILVCVCLSYRWTNSVPWSWCDTIRDRFLFVVKVDPRLSNPEISGGAVRLVAYAL